MMKARTALAALAVLIPATQWAMPAQAQDWFVPQGQQQTRPAQPAQQQRPAQQPAQRPAAQPAAGRPALAPGQAPPDAIIGVVDVPEVQRNSTAFNGVREEIERRRQKLNEDLQKEQAGWRDAQQQLQQERAALTPDQQRNPPEALRNRERELQEKITEGQRVFRDRSRAIEQAAQTALNEIERALAGVVRQVAANHKVNLVLPRPLVIYNDPPFDLTDEISQQLNKALRSVTLAKEEAAPAAQAEPQAAKPAQQRR